MVECPGTDLCAVSGHTCACAGSIAAADQRFISQLFAGNNTSGLSPRVTAGDDLCALHSKGPFCMLCEPGFYRKVG